MPRLTKMTTGIALVCVLLSQPSFAQTPNPLPSTPIATLNVTIPVNVARLGDEALRTWIRDYTAWQEWAEKYLNRRQWAAHPFPYPFWKENPDLFSYVVPRRAEPEPPSGLGAACAGRAGSSAARDTLAQSCALLTVWQDDYSTQRIRWAVATTRAQKDDTSRSRFFEHIHFASLWTNLQTAPGGRAYGLAGVHATIDVKGRWQIYALPGIIAVSLPNLQGRRTVTVGYDWGFAVRLFNSRVPYLDLPVKVHLNLVQVWMPEVQQKIDMIGLSFTANRAR
jgi:hypothetical protein